MSLDLVVLTARSATSYEQALRVYYEDEAGAADEERLSLFARELGDAFGTGDWPFAGDPIVLPSHVLLAVAPEWWMKVVPDITARAHRHDLVVLDPQAEALFPPGSEYADASADLGDDDEPPRLKLEMTVHYSDGASEDMGVVYDTSRWWRWGPGRLATWFRVTRKAAARAWRDRP